MRLPLALLLILSTVLGCKAKPTPTTGLVMPRLSYPMATKGNVVEVLHGTQVADPYRWLETDSPETRAWISAENAVTSEYLSSIRARDAIKERIARLWDFERFEPPLKRGGRYFFLYNSGLANQASLYWVASLAGEPKPLIDPNAIAADGTVTLKDVEPSDDGKLVAYGLGRAGSDWTEWRVRRVDDGVDLPDRLEWTKFTSVAWSKDNQGFYYSRYQAPAPGAAHDESNYNNRLYYHRLGEPQAADALIYERPDQKEWSFSASVSDDGRYLIVTVSKGTDHKHGVLFRDLKGTKRPLVELVSGFDAEYSFIGNQGSIFWFKTDNAAPRGRVVALDTRDPKRELIEIIPQLVETLIHVERAGHRFIANYLSDAHAELRVFDAKGKLEHEIALPEMGSVWGPVGQDSSTDVFFGFESFTRPRAIYRYDVATQALAVFREPKLVFDPHAYETKQIFYPSKDGTRVPMFVVKKRDAAVSSETPCLLYGYGGFGISITPSFGVDNLSWLELGGILAVPNLRGGGEYGEQWHNAGKKSLKQNVFDDFIAAAEYLIAQGLTSTPKLALHGRSNGGLLVGAMLTERPDLFAAALPGVGVLDMLRFHKFTIGWAWVDDYGSPDDPEEFKSLLAYSPLHNIKPGTKYPATLITTADHDDRVVPAHSFKFAAALQAAQAGEAPILIRIDTEAGHGAGKPTNKRIAEIADQWAFLTKVLEMKVPSTAP